MEVKIRRDDFSHLDRETVWVVVEGMRAEADGLPVLQTLWSLCRISLTLRPALLLPAKMVLSLLVLP